MKEMTGLSAPIAIADQDQKDILELYDKIQRSKQSWSVQTASLRTYLIALRFPGTANRRSQRRQFRIDHSRKMQH